MRDVRPPLDAAADCPHCPYSALLDVRLPANRLMLLEEDRRRAERRSDQLRWASVPVGMVLGALIIYWEPLILAFFPPLPFPMFLRAILLMCVISAGLVRPRQAPARAQALRRPGVARAASQPEASGRRVGGREVQRRGDPRTLLTVNPKKAWID